MSEQVMRIVLTGPPGSGKTSALARIGETLPNAGVTVYTVPEVATELILGGFRPWEMEPGVQVSFQCALMELQRAQEETAMTLARAIGKRAVVVCDRGCMDSKAYVDQTVWDAAKDKMRVDEIDLREQRYDAVVHMEAAPEKYYTLANNVARTESYERAVALDKGLREAWTGHPRHYIVSSMERFEDKMVQVSLVVNHAVGTPVQTAYRRKFMVHVLPTQATEGWVRVDIEQRFLKQGLGILDSYERRVRKRTQGGTSVYTYTEKDTYGGKRLTRCERLLAPEEYVRLCAEQVGNTIVKSRYYRVLRDGRVAELDIFGGKLNGYRLLEIASFSEDGQDVPELPGIEVFREVTDYPSCYNETLAYLESPPWGVEDRKRAEDGT